MTLLDTGLRIDEALCLRLEHLIPQREAGIHSSRQVNEAESLVLNGLVFSNDELAHESDRRDRYRNPRPTRRGPSQSLKSAA